MMRLWMRKRGGSSSAGAWVFSKAKAGTPSMNRLTSLKVSRFSSAKKPCPSATSSPKSRVQAWSTRG